jgi:hypothetical protein
VREDVAAAERRRVAAEAERVDHGAAPAGTNHRPAAAPRRAAAGRVGACA